MVVSCEMKWHSNVSGHVASYMEEPSSSLWDRTPAGIIIHLSLGSDRAIAISNTWIFDPTIILVFLYFFFLFCTVLYNCSACLNVLLHCNDQRKLSFQFRIPEAHRAEPSHGSTFSRKSRWYPHSASMPSQDNRSSFSPFWAEKKLATYFPPIKTWRSFQ